MWPFKKKSINPIINLNKSGLTDTQVRTLQEAKCPDCNGELRREDGCQSCPKCGWSRCH